MLAKANLCEYIKSWILFNIFYIKQSYYNTVGKVLKFPEEAGCGLNRDGYNLIIMLS